MRRRSIQSRATDINPTTLQLPFPSRCINMQHEHAHIYMYIMKLWLLLIYYYYYTNTCSETSYRITDWCGMHRTCKNTSVNLTGAIGWSGVKTYAKDIIQLVLMQLIHSQKTMEVQIAKTVQKGIGRPIGRHAGSWLGRSPFLNIDIEKMKQVRHGDQPWYPHVLWPLRWTIAHSTWMVPLL